MSLKDIINNIKLAYYQTTVETKDAFEKKPIEDKLKEMGISYVKGFNGHSYSYAIVGVKGGFNKLCDFLDWFKGDKKLKYTMAKHRWFKTPIYRFSR